MSVRNRDNELDAQQPSDRLSELLVILVALGNLLYLLAIEEEKLGYAGRDQFLQELMPFILRH